MTVGVCPCDPQLRVPVFFPQDQTDRSACNSRAVEILDLTLDSRSCSRGQVQRDRRLRSALLHSPVEARKALRYLHYRSVTVASKAGLPFGYTKVPVCTLGLIPVIGAP